MNKCLWNFSVSFENKLKFFSFQSYAPPPPVYPDEPRLYKYAYSVDDDYEGAVLNVKEASDEYATHGSYEVNTL